MTHYEELKNTHIEPVNCFYAFSNKQYDEAIKEKKLEGQKIYKTSISGLYGTKEGLDAYYAKINEHTKRIPKECTPQEVYDYEFINHECGYVGSDEEAIEIVRTYFGFNVIVPKRRCAADNYPNSDPETNYKIFWYGVIDILEERITDLLKQVPRTDYVEDRDKLMAKIKHLKSIYEYALDRNSAIKEERIKRTSVLF